MMLRVELRPLAASIVVVVRQLDPSQVRTSVTCSDVGRCAVVGDMFILILLSNARCCSSSSCWAHRVDWLVGVGAVANVRKCWYFVLMENSPTRSTFCQVSRKVFDPAISWIISMLFCPPLLYPSLAVWGIVCPAVQCLDMSRMPGRAPSSSRGESTKDKTNTIT